MERTAGSVLNDRQAGPVSITRPPLSVSQLKMYLRCPLQYFFRYECHLKVPPTADLSLGRTIHQTLNDNYGQKIKTGHDIIVPHITELFSEHWEREVQETEFKNGESPGKFKDDGVGLLKAILFGVAITLTSLYRGFEMKHQMTEVPVATSRSAVEGFLHCLVINVIISISFYL